MADSLKILSSVMMSHTTLCRKLCHESFSRFELDHGERFAVSSARSALALPRPRLLCAQVLCRLFPPSFPLLPAA